LVNVLALNIGLEVEKYGIIIWVGLWEQAQEWYREDLVGQALLKSGVPREQVFLTSKLHPRSDLFPDSFSENVRFYICVAGHDAQVC
jgi:hypothetical protein